MIKKCKKAQTTLEYALLFTAVLLAVIYGANTVIKAKAKENMDVAGGILDKAKTELQTATGTAAPAAPAPNP